MYRSYVSRMLLVLGLILTMAGAGISARENAPKAGVDQVATAPSKNLVPSEVTCENYLAKAVELDINGVRAAKVVDRKDLPGGPWATGSIGDFVLENGKIRVVIQGMNRSAKQSDRAFGLGQIIDIALEDQMWDQFGGISQQVRIDGKMIDVQYDGILINKPSGPKEGPYLTAHGKIGGEFGFPVVTKMTLVPHEPLLIVETAFGNRTDKEYPVRLYERVNWGGLPIFVGGYGHPRYMTAIDNLNTHWMCGQLDDFCLGMVKSGSEATRIARVQFNTSYMAYEDHVLKPQKFTTIGRSFLVTRGDMAPVSEYALKTKNCDFGYLEGKVVQLPEGHPVPGAKIEVSMFNPFKSRDESPLPYAITKTDMQGRYRIALPEGGAVATTVTPGRVPRPVRSLEMKIRKGMTIPNNIRQSPVRTVVFEAVDAETDEPIPAKVRFKPLDTTARARAFSFGPPWKASGGRQVFYLKPGPNKIPISGGKFRCIFSRGPEYKVVELDLDLGLVDQQTIKVELRRVVPTDGMVSLALNLATEISPTSRVSAEDLVLAAAGEGLEWIFSGDLGEVTDLNRAIRSQGLEKWIRASGGVHLSYQHQKLFGEFYVFPVPLDTPKDKLAALAGPETAPSEFFGNVRKAFPGAIISVTQPAFASASYLHYYGLDARVSKDTPLGQMPTSKYFSLDFDAIEVCGSRDTEVRKAGLGIMKMLLRNGHYKFPLAASKTETVFYDEPGYPRVYLVTGENDAAKMDDADVAKALRGGKYFITTGPIIEHKIDGKWPDTLVSPAHGEFKQSMSVLAAPWAQVNFVAFEGLPLYRFSLRPDKKNEEYPEYVRFPYDKESAKPVFRKIEKDSIVHVEVRGESIEQVVTEHMGQPLKGFAFTPPVLLDADGDGEYHYE